MMNFPANTMIFPVKAMSFSVKMNKHTQKYGLIHEHTYINKKLKI